MSAIVAAAPTTARAARTARGVRIQRNVVFEQVDGQALRMDVYIPTTGGGPFPAIELIHGGGFDQGSRRFMQPMGIYLAQAGYVGFTIDYRLAPRYPYPAAVEDARAALTYMRDRAGQYQVDPKRIGVFGGSAGGTIAAELATSGSGPLDQGVRVAALVTWSSVLDLRPLLQGPLQSHDPRLVRYLFGTSTPSSQELKDVVDKASPILHVSCDDPPAFVANSMKDLVPLFEATSFVDALKRANVPNQLLEPPRGHAGQYTPVARQPTAAFLDKYLRPGPYRAPASCTSATNVSPPPVASTGGPSGTPPSRAPTSPGRPARWNLGPIVLIVAVALVVGLAVLLLARALSRR